jgi:predicted DNA-binding transcriptional regulator YafY
MSLLKAIKRLEYINHLIKTKSTGNLEKLARRCNLSKRAMTDFLNFAREMGADIRYDRARETYYYVDAGEITISRFMKYGEILTRDTATSIGKPDDLCFDEKAVFVRCKDI